MPGPFSTDQGALYDELTPLKESHRRSRSKRLTSRRSSASRAPLCANEDTGRPGLTIVRDSHDIPHVYGETRGDVMFGSGWVAARGPRPAAGARPRAGVRGRARRPRRQPVRAAADPALVHAERRRRSNSSQNRKKCSSKRARRANSVIQDLEEWVEGINAYEATLGPQRIAAAASACPTRSRASRSSARSSATAAAAKSPTRTSSRTSRRSSATEEGLKVFHDLREVNDPEAPTTARKPFPYDRCRADPTPGRGRDRPGLDRARRRSKAAQVAEGLAPQGVELPARRRRTHTKNGHPVAVMGPQLGYFYPEIVFQADLHGPGIDAQGVDRADLAVRVHRPRARLRLEPHERGQREHAAVPREAVQPRRTTKPADARIEPLRVQRRMHPDEGRSTPASSAQAAAEPAHEVFFKETVHGPVSGTVTVGGKPYAIANDRSTRGREPAGELAFSDLDSDEVHSAAAVLRSGEPPRDDVQHGLPRQQAHRLLLDRTPAGAGAGTDPSLPTLGTGRIRLARLPALEQHPHDVDPGERALFTNWNNKPAPEWGAASDNYAYGPVQRVQMYNGFTTGMNEASDVSIMNRAATQDLRAVKVWPTIEQVLAGGPAPSKLAEEAREHDQRMGRGRGEPPRPEQPKAPGRRSSTRPGRRSPKRCSARCSANCCPNSRRSPRPTTRPRRSGSAYDSGWYGYVYKDLRTILGEPVAAALQPQYCGSGSLEACRASLWAAIQQRPNSSPRRRAPTPSTWRAANVRIKFPPGLAASHDALDQPLDLPAGDRIHRPRRKAAGSESARGSARIAPATTASGSSTWTQVTGRWSCFRTAFPTRRPAGRAPARS